MSDWAVFRIEEPSLLTTVLNDDLISRQSISLRDHPDGGKVILLEGSSEAISRMLELAPESRIEDEEALKIYEEIKRQETDVTAGIGAIFD